MPTRFRFGSTALTAGLVVLGGLLHPIPVQAIEIGGGEIQGNLDTTISHGMTFRVEKRNAGLAADTNGNDGDLNYNRGIVSNTSKFTTDLDVGSGDFGAFVRATGFVDFENQNGTRERTPLSDAAKDKVGKDLEVLDAYVTGTFDAGDSIVDVRLGRHVLNWGESTFIPNGINAINHFDVSKLRQPGSELREALLPVGLASMSVSPSDILSVEGFYQLDWEETEIDPVGSYFSSTDYAGPGARKAVITNVMERLLPNRPLEWDRGFEFGPSTTGALALAGVSQPDFDPDFASVLRGPDRTPSDSGQWGLALRYLAEDFNDTELGFYYINYHSRLPVVGAQTGTRSGLHAGLDAAFAIGQAAQSNPALAPLAPLAPALAVDRYGKSGHYFLEYPEDIQLFGMSFNTVLGASGWALQGEYSIRRDAPLQRAERVVLEEGLRPIIRGLGLLAAAGTSEGGLAYGNFRNNYTPSKITGYIERDVSQAQATATKVFGPTLGADGLVFVTELALMHVHDMPDKNTSPLESPAGGTLATGKADADGTSWGYRVAARLDYNNAIGGANLFPYTQFLHDVTGNSPAPSGPFVEGRTALTLGVRADYLSRWQADIGYTRYAGKGNELSDRDFISASVKYSF
ncbi:MAG: DUF1302 domain-containing protein [Thiotrichales bacterium]|nr:DUF1302 domain-containing protein [Thiotrichales bacterium]